MPTRRDLLRTTAHTCTATAAAALAMTAAPDAVSSEARSDRQRIFIFTMVGSENPTRANFPIVWAGALHEAGHDVRLELAGDATVLMRDVVVENTAAVGWPSLKEPFDKVIKYEIPIYV